MRIQLLIVGAGLLVLGSGTALAQAGPPMPGGTLGPNASAVVNGTREQMQGYNHVVSNLDHGQPANGAKSAGAVRKVVASEIIVGAAVRDMNGQAIGKVASVAADGVVIDTGSMKVKVPLIAFGRDNNGLLIGITAQKFAELTSKAHAQSAAAAPAKPEPRPATVADIATGAPLRDSEGKLVGKITFVSADGATIDTGQTKVKLPIDSFGVDTAGLVLPITLLKLKEMIAQSRAAAAAAAKH
jgi:hypothetical protein